MNSTRHYSLITVNGRPVMQAQSFDYSAPRKARLKYLVDGSFVPGDFTEAEALQTLIDYPGFYEIVCEPYTTKPASGCECGAFKASGAGMGSPAHSTWCPWGAR